MGEIRHSVEEAGRLATDRESLGRALRTLRQKEIARIGWRDLIGAAPLKEVVATLSELADAAISAALDCAIVRSPSGMANRSTMTAMYRFE
ncbi:MAG: hypothetical protein CM1200mP20_11700 [Pseudomonadota bacterium]|nr:MAG: hypothetical protein CM1200mP20_11700 [Pseudomonadota bacterium]